MKTKRAENFLTRVDGGALGDEVDRRVVAMTDPASAAAEQYRILYYQIERAREVSPLKILAVTSAMVGEGKTLTAANLALTAARTAPERRVLLWEADFGFPSLDRLLGFASRPGLAEVIAGEVGLEQAVRQFAGTRLSVLPAGRAQIDAGALFGSRGLRAFTEALRGRFDEVYLDAAPLLSTADGALASRLADAVLLVVRAGATPQRYLGQALGLLDGARVLGCVLNRVDGSEVPYLRGRGR